MILQRLAAYYDRLLAEGAVEAPGFQAKEILWVVDVDADGRFVQLTRTGDEKRGKRFVVPAEIKKTSGIASNLLWENPEYAFGVPRTGSDEKQAAKVPLRHAAFIDRLKALPDEVRADAGVAAVRKFLTEGDRSPLLTDENWADLTAGGANVSFRLDGDHGLVCERPAVRAGLSVAEDQNPDAVTRCLVTGRMARPARLHPSIKGVRGAQSSGASLVSFNDPAYKSHGWEQGDNAPVSTEAAQAYAAALNHLLDRSTLHHSHIEGEATFVYWAAAPTRLEGEFSYLLGGPPDGFTPDGRPVGNLFASIRAGIRPCLDDDTPFHVLGLAPNAARLAVRYWHEGTVAEMAGNILAHFDDLAIDGLDQSGLYPATWRLLGCAAPDGDPKRLGDQLRGRLSGELMAAILDRRPYPATLLARTVERCRLEQSVRVMRAALIKAILNRSSERKITVSLDESDRNPGYLLGRLFAVLENIQRTAQPDINTTIRQRYFGGAMAAPRGVFVRLAELKNAHLKKVARDKGPNLAGWFDKRIDQIMDGFVAADGLPSSLSLDQQARFVLGYHHERNHRTAPAETAADTGE